MSREDTTTDPFSGIQLLSEDAFRSLGSMEAVEWEAPPPEKSKTREIVPGFALAAGVTLLALTLQGILPESIPLGAAVLAMVVGMTIRNILPVSGWTAVGCRWIVTHLIPLAIVMVGAGLNLGVLASDGLRFLGFVLTSVFISSISAVLLGRLLGVAPRTALLIGTGTGICGSSAILAVAPAIDADEDDILLSVGAINLIGLVAMFACIGFASVVETPATGFGILTGATIHAVPTVAAAAFDHSAEAGQIATLVKMGRVAMLVPFVLMVSVVWNWKRGGAGRAKSGRKRWSQFVPWFVWGFAATAALGTLGLIPDLRFSGKLIPDAELIGTNLLSSGGKLLLTLAMAAIGLQVGVKSMIRTGGRAVLLATVVWAILFGAILLVGAR